MVLPGRRYSPESQYRYRFNGKEKSDEIYGEGNAYDFGARIQDPRLGRWLSVDPLQSKYPSLSPYNFCINNPIVLNDPDGRDAMITVTNNSDGSSTLKVQTIVNMTGATQPLRERGYNKEAKSVFSDQKVDVEGKTWNIQYEITYVYDRTFDQSKMKQGENVLIVDPNTADNGPNRAHVGPIGNNKGWISLRDRYDNKVVAHETGHLIGFTDQYTEVNAKSSGFIEYLRGKYNSKEDLVPGGTLYKMLTAADQLDLTIELPNEGYENNEMRNDQGGFTSEQNTALVNKAVNISKGKDGTFLMSGIFDTRKTPKKEDLQKAYETIEAKLKEKTKG